MSFLVEKFIDGIYIFESTGQLIYFKNYSNRTIDPAIVSGFFSAIQMFTENMIDKGSRIQEINLHNNDLIFDVIDNGNIVIMALTSGKNSNEAKEILQRISRGLTFVLKYRNLSLEGLNTFLEIYINNISKMKEEIKIEYAEGTTNRQNYFELKPLRTIKALTVKLTQEEHSIINLCDGQNSLKSISEKLGRPYFQIMPIIIKFQKEGLVNQIKTY
jgi:hypothetical protein